VVNLPLNETVPTRVYEVKLVVIDAFGIPISSAKVTCTLANGTQVKATTDSQGTVNLQLIPIGENYAAASNFGMSASTGFDASQEQSAALTVFASDATIALVAAVLLAIAIIVVGVVYRERRLNKITY
ncbi:MAG TPA: carboxypeptidase regulatory-like domain-containing protein, partial [Candidatus Nanoarchaeia archaeon]|nr:carboxypeptidase regulatory-like domain-containing protein [Candidatus Nanoarchaeia archaeon]